MRSSVVYPFSPPSAGAPVSSTEALLLERQRAHCVAGRLVPLAHRRRRSPGSRCGPSRRASSRGCARAPSRDSRPRRRSCRSADPARAPARRSGSTRARAATTGSTAVPARTSTSRRSRRASPRAAWRCCSTNSREVLAADLLLALGEHDHVDRQRAARGRCASAALTWRKSWPLSSTDPRAKILPSRTVGSNGGLRPQLERLGGLHVVVAVDENRRRVRPALRHSPTTIGWPASGGWTPCIPIVRSCSATQSAPAPCRRCAPSAR